VPNFQGGGSNPLIRIFPSPGGGAVFFNGFDPLSNFSVCRSYAEAAYYSSKNAMDYGNKGGKDGSEPSGDDFLSFMKGRYHFFPYHIPQQPGSQNIRCIPRIRCCFSCFYKNSGKCTILQLQ
jgi:hypothetical protein